MPETWDGQWHSLVQCPACNYIDRETCDYPDSLRHDGDEATMTCDRCDAEFKVTLALDPRVRTELLPHSPSSGDADGGGR